MLNPDKKLKEDKIFGFNNFSDFREKYFPKPVVLLESEHRT